MELNLLKAWVIWYDHYCCCDVIMHLIPQVNLVTLDLANNYIKKLENISHLLKLEEFWVRILVGHDFLCHF